MTIGRKENLFSLNLKVEIFVMLTKNKQTNSEPVLILGWNVYGAEDSDQNIHKHRLE